MPASGTPPQPADQAGSTDSTNHRPRRRRRPAVRLVLLTVIAVLLGASQAAPAVHLDPPDLSGLPEGAYVALGDSYASGFGVPPYAEGTDVTGGNTCRRSAGSYAHIVSERTRRPLEMGACSGARTRNFYEANESWGEAAQLDRLGPDTGLVTFSIGGNDAGFARILGDCIGGGDRGFLSAAGCSSDAEVTGAVDGAIDALAGKTTRDGVYSYEALRSRLAEGRFGGAHRDLLSPVIRLAPLTHEEMLVLIEKLAVIHAELYGYAQIVTQDDLADFIRIEFGRIGADTHITPREVIRDFIQVLDIIYQNPTLKIADLLGSEEFSYAQNEVEGAEISAQFAEFEL